MARTTQSEAGKSASRSKPVVRDPNFVRLMADDVVVVNLGRDMELALVVIGNPIAELTRIESEESLQLGVKYRPEMAEVGRVRLSPFSALSMSMNVLSKLVESGQINTELLRSSIESMISEAPADATKVPSE